MSRSRLVRGLLTAVLAAALGGCGARQRDGVEVPPGTPVVLVSIDTLRSDHLPAYGYRGVATPAIDRLRRDGILFERAWAPAPLTLPSHASLLTGLAPDQHRVRDNIGYRLTGSGGKHLPQLLQELGYATGAAVSSYVVRGETGLAAGFDRYDDEFPTAQGELAVSAWRPGRQTVARALDWTRSVAGRPFFLFVHLFEPHLPYEPPEPFASRYPSRYDGEIAAADQAVGELVAELERLGAYDRALVILLSDHGEGLGEHGEQEHGILLYRETLQVPLLVKLPGAERAGARVAAPAQLIDVAPTLAGLLGAAASPEWRGASLLDLGKDGAPARRVVSETFYGRIHFGWSELVSVTDGARHYIDGPDPELYDLRADPGETRNLLARERRAAAELRRELESYDRGLDPPAQADAETRRQLAALGYLAGGPAADTGGPRPDPKRELPSLAALQSAFELYRREDYAEAAAAFRAVVAANPRVLDGWEFLGRALERTGQHREAAAAYERALELSGGDPDLALSLAALQIRGGELDRGLATARLAQRLGGGGTEMVVRVARQLVQSGRLAEAAELLRPAAEAGDGEAVTELALILSEQGDQTEAARLLERQLASHPTSAAAHEAAGLVALRRGDAAGAREHSRRAVVLEPGRARAWNNLGVALYMAGERAGAFAAWQRAVELDPTEYDALFNLGVKAAQAGRRVMAQRALQQFVDTAPPARYGADLDRARGLLRQLGG